MPKVEDIKVLNIDDVPYAVDSMSDQVKQLVEIYNDWNRDEADARNRLMQVQCAKNDLSRQIIVQVRTERVEAEKAKAEKAKAEKAEAEKKATPADTNVAEVSAADEDENEATK